MSKTELRRQSIYTWMLVTFTAIMFFVMAHQSRAQNFNWDGENADGGFLNSDNWYGNTIPSFSYSGSLIFNYINNASQTSQYYNFASWANANDIVWENTLQRAATLNGNGQGINFMQRLENKSSYTVTIGSSMNLSGGKNGATQIELNPVNGDMTINGNIYNDFSKSYKVYGTNTRTVTINTSLGVGTNASIVGFSVEQYSKAYFTAAQNYTGATDIKTGELWIGTGGSLNSASRVNLGLTDTNVAKFYLTGGVTNSNNITVLSTNTAGSKVLGGLSSSGTNVFAGNVTNNNSGGVWLENTVAGGTVAFTGVLSGTGSVTAGGLGTVQLRGTNNTFSGNVTVNSGVLSGAQWLTNSSVGVSSFGNHDTNGNWLILNGGTVQYTGATNNSYFMKLNVSTNGGTVDSSGAGILNLAKGANGFTMAGNDTANRTFTLTGTNNASLGSRNNFNGSITNGAGGAVVTVVKSGTGTWELGYNGNTFSGGLEIRQGNLIFGGGTALQTNSVGLGDVKMFNDSGIGSSSTTIRTGSVSTTFKLGGTNVMAYVDLPKVVLTNNTIINNGTNVSTTGGIAYSNNAANFIATLGSVSGVSETGGSYSLTKIGGGILTLNGANSYSGGTIMSNGVLYVTNTGTLGSASSAVTLAGGILDLGNATRTNGTVTVSGGTLTNGTVSATTINISGGTLTGAGLTASSAFNYGGGATGLASAVLGGAGRFYLTNSTLTLSDNFNTLTGGIGLTGGTLTLTNASNLGSGSFLLGSAGTLGTLQVNTTTSATNGFVVNDSSTNTSINVASGQTFTMSGTISQTNGNNNATKFGKDGAGTLVMAGSNGTYGGQLQIGQGTVVVGVNNALGTNVTTSARGVDLGLNVGDTAMTNNVALLLSNGVTFGQSIYVATNSSSATRTIGLSGTGASGSFTNEIYQDGDLTLDAGSSTGTLTVSGAIVTNNAAVAKGIIVTNGTTVLSGNNSYSGLTTVGVGGTLKLGSANALGAANANADGSTGGVLLFGNLDLNGQTITGEGLRMKTDGYVTNSSTTTAVWNGGIFLTNSTNTFATGLGRDITLSGAGITNASPSRTLVKSGAGVLNLNVSNNINGQINVNVGTLRLGNAGALGSGVSSNVAVAAGATLDVNGNTISGTRTFTISGSGTNSNGALYNGSASAATFSNAITLGADGSIGSVGDLTVSGNITGAFAMSKLGSGKVILTGSNNFSGGTVVNAGILAIGANNNAISGGALTLSGGTLQTTGTSMNFSVGAVTFGGSGELQLAANGKLVSTGVVTVNDASNFINLTAALGTYTIGNTYDLLTGTSLAGSGAISLKGLAVGGQTIALGGSSSVGRTTYSFSNTSTAYQLSVTGGSAYNLTWNPATSSGTWNTTDTNTPWLNNTDSSSTYFATGDNVTFGSAAAIAVDAGGVTAGTMALTNATGTVALSGGSIGASSLTQSGAGTVTMSNALLIAGALTNSAGTLANNSTTAANSLVVSGGTVDLNGAASITNGVTVSGGAVTLATNSTITGGVALSSGTLALNGSNSVTGGVNVTGGRLEAGNNSALGASVLTLNGGSLAVTNSAATLLTNNITIGAGAATISNSVATTLGGSITNVSGSANLTLTKDGSGALTLTNALGASGTTGSIALNVTNGNLVLSGAAKYITNSQINTGAKVILDGVTVNARGAKLGGGGTIEVTNNSAWNNSVGNSSITNTVAIGSGSKLSVGTSSSFYLEFLNGITGAGNFTVTTGGTNRITGNSTVAYMTVDSGGRLYLNNGTASNTVITNNGTVDIGISSGITNITGLSSGTTTYNGNISGNGNISISGSQNIYLAGNISGSNNVSLDSGSTGTQVFLTGSNSFSGGINFAHTNARQAYFGNSNALGTGTISNNTSTTSTLAYSGSANTADYTFANAFYTGTTNTAILNIQTGISNTVRLGGVVSGLGQFKITSSSNGIVYLNNANNTYSGGTEIGTGKIGVGSDGAFGVTTGAVNFGTAANSWLVATSNISFNANRNFTMNSATYTANIDTGANNVTINGGFTGTGGGNLNKIGTGSLTLAGVANYTGTTTLGAGTLNLGGNTITNTALTITTGILTNGSIKVDNSGTGITVNGNSTIAANLSGAADFTLGNANTTNRLSGSNSLSGQISLGSGAVGQTLEVTGTNALSSAANLNGSSSSANTPTLSLLAGGAYTMNKYKDGNMLFKGTNSSTTSLTFTNTTNHTISAGSKSLTASNVNVTFAGDVDLAANITNKKVTLEGNSDFAFNGAITNSGVSYLITTTTTNTNTGVITTNNSYATNAYLVMNSSGALTLAASNSFDGGVVMSNGTVAISNNAAFGTGAVGISNNATVRALANLTVANNYDLGTNNNKATFDVGSGLALTNSGVISGKGSIEKTGTGTLHLTGANTYSNAATVTGGTLAGNTSSLIGNITNNATVEFVQATTGTYSNVISGSGAFRKSGAGELTLNQANTFAGGATITAGTLKLNRAGNGTGGTIVGTIAVNGGTLLLGQANQISDSSAVTLGGGTINTGGFADQAGKLTVSAGSAISGLVATTGGAATANDFLFSSVDLTNYATSSGSTLNLGGGYSYGATINISSSNYTGWSGYSTTSLNNFSDKVLFGSTGMKAQINFNGTTGLTYITAIPEPKVYVAMAMLVVLVGVTEYKRRKRAVKV